MEEQASADNKAEDFYKICKSESNRLALERVRAMDLPRRISLTIADVTGISRGHDKRIAALFDGITKEYGERSESLYAFANQAAWFALWNGAESINQQRAKDREELAARIPLDTPVYPPTTADDYAEFNGMAYTLYNELPDVKTVEASGLAALRADCNAPEDPSVSRLLEVASLYWTACAVRAIRAGDQAAGLEWLFEASEARALAEGIFMWDGAMESCKDAKSLQIVPATSARIEIGRRSREKTLAAAAPFRGRMSREAAAPHIAEIVGKSPATVRRELSKQFPGAAWDVSDDLTG